MKVLPIDKNTGIGRITDTERGGKVRGLYGTILSMFKAGLLFCGTIGVPCDLGQIIVLDSCGFICRNKAGEPIMFESVAQLKNVIEME